MTGSVPVHTVGAWRRRAAPEAPVTASRNETRAISATLFAELQRCPKHHPARTAARDQLVALHLPLVEHLARRFRNRGEPYDDLMQVGTIGLIKAIDRFDPERGVEFSTYATPTVVGEIKRHFRDKGWAIRVPRRLQELRLSLGLAGAELAQELGRSPTVGELADRLGLEPDRVLEGIESANAYTTLSLDAPETADDPRTTVGQAIGIEDDALENVEYRAALRPLLAKLDERERQILLLRFFGGKTQSQIANELGISQMHVSRLLARTLESLRGDLLETE
ncbi:MAG: RNA polymerase sigma factor SigF [Nocardioidaceae bacterium]